jgi:uncharacterized protein YndB with AHSA1/START domain
MPGRRESRPKPAKGRTCMDIPMKADFLHRDVEGSALPFPPDAAAGRSARARLPDLRERAHGERPHDAARAPLTLVRRYPYSAASVFAAWVAPALAGQWLFATASRPMLSTRIDARVGGRYCLTEQRGGRIVEHRGEYVDVTSPHRLVMTLSTPDVDGETRIAIAIAARTIGSALTLTHAGVRPHDIQRIRQRWIGMLYGLGAMLDRADAASHCNDD